MALLSISLICLELLIFFLASTPLDYLFQHQGSGRVVQAGVLPGADEPIKPGRAGRQDLRQYVLQHLKVRHSTGQGICILHGQPGPVAITSLYFDLFKVFF